MSEYELDVFSQTSGYVELRFSRGREKPPRTRGLNKSDVDGLVDEVARLYAQDSGARKVFGSRQLHELGERLFGFLDGPERWLTDAVADSRGSVLRISGLERLRHLPWELMARDGSPLAVSATGVVLPVRTSGASTGPEHPAAPGNRPLRVLFMATSPEGVEPVLGYEAEEAAILAATSRTGAELVVEESGTLDGLRLVSKDYGDGYFDVLHLSGHAKIKNGQPVFLVENEFGGSALATSEGISEAIGGHWPRMMFVSGCLTGGAPDAGAFPSMSESLVRAGAPAVLGWALPVGDVAATEFAARLYQELAAGERLDDAAVTARRQLYAQQRSNWHLLRVYADKSPLGEMVTPLNTRGRARLTIRHAAEEFLDPQTRLSRVAPRAAFVGRRRAIQRCLRVLKQPQGSSGAAEALVLQGMGGLGKSTLASRLLERMPTHQRVVWFGRVDAVKFRELTSKVTFPSVDDQVEATKLLDDERAPLVVRLRHLLGGPLGTTPCLFVFDDFEEGNLDPRDGEYVLSGEMAGILPALLTAIRETGSPSRVIITSRYRFPAPAGTTIVVESLETFTDVEQTKKLANLANLRPGSPLDPTIRDRAITAAAGNPRLLDWLDLVVADKDLDIDGLIRAIENEADRFRRETVLATHLLDSQPIDLQRMLAEVNVVELPVPVETVHAVHAGPDTARHVGRAVRLGLLEEGTDPETGLHRYYVSNVLRPLLRPLITDEEYTKACAAAARSLYDLWVLNSAGPETGS